MKRILATMSLLTAMLVLTSAPDAYAGNSGVEAALQNYGDLSMFYQALLNTGVINELKEGERYTVFAPTNASFFNEVSRQTYPCFYAVECRPQIAVLLRNHILEGRYDLAELVSYGQGLRTIGNTVIHVGEPFVGDYEVNDKRIMSQAEIVGNSIYRIAGVITTPQELRQFQTVAFVVPPADTVTTTTTVQKTTTVVPESSRYPAGTMVLVPPADGGQTTTITHTYTTEQ